MPRPAALPPINVQRSWTERHAHHNLRIIEDHEGHLWFRVDDLRQWMPGLPNGHSLQQRHPGLVRCVPPSIDPYLEASTFLWLTQKSTNVPTLKLRAWLEASVIGPVQKRNKWGSYPGISSSGIPSALISADPEKRSDLEPGEPPATTSTRRIVDPRLWLVARGEWGLKTTLAVGAAGSFVAVLLSGKLTEQAWDVDNNYLFWTWCALLLATWAVLFNLAWALGALRSGMRRVSDRFNPWLTTGLVAVNLAAAAYMSATTAQNSGYLLHLWWAAYVTGSPPVSVQATAWQADGSVRQLSLKGGIGIGSTNALRHAISEHPTATELVLDSPGGLVIEGFGLADAISASGIKTTIVMEKCSSSCTLPYLSGDRRILGRDAIIGFHRSYSIFGDFGSGWSPVEHRMADLMRERRVSEAFIRRAFDTPGWDMYEADVDQLIRSGVATESL